MCHRKHPARINVTAQYREGSGSTGPNSVLMPVIPGLDIGLVPIASEKGDTSTVVKKIIT